MHAIARTLRHWLTAQLTILSCVGGLTAFALWLIDVEYWLIFGLLAAILDIVPYVGPILAGLGIALVTLGSNPDQLVLVVAALFIVQQLEGYVITPLIMRGRIELPPIYLIAVMFIMGSWFGIIGIFVAPPLLAVIRTILLTTYIPAMNNRTQPASRSSRRTISAST